MDAFFERLQEDGRRRISALDKARADRCVRMVVCGIQFACVCMYACVGMYACTHTLRVCVCVCLCACLKVCFRGTHTCMCLCVHRPCVLCVYVGACEAVQEAVLAGMLAGVSSRLLPAEACLLRQAGPSVCRCPCRQAIHPSKSSA